jgi:ubiquinone/menaquinone biosynthesis C-methylase UbiE
MHKLWQTPVEMKLIKRALETQVGRSSSEQVLQKASHLAINPLGIELYEGRAHDLALLESSSADNLFAMFMMYHLTTEQREQAFSEFKRVLKPDGNIIIATSGASNKKRHREFEAAIGKALSIQPPRPMNVGFTTEKATEEVPRYFKNVYVYCQNTSMIIGRSEESIQAYYDSIRSLRDQFEPIPSEEDFNEALYSEVDPAIYQAIIKDGVFTDTIQRSLIIASDDELNDAKLVENGFKKLV